MRKLYVLFLLTANLLIVTAAMGQQTISGKVTDTKTGETVPGVIITQKGGKGTVSDAAGSFTLNVTGTDSVAIEVSHLGYEKLMMKAKPGSVLTIKLVQGAYLTSTVVVTGSRLSENIFESPVTIYKIDSRAIQGSASGDFYQSMGNLPGVDVVNTSFGLKMFNTRGFNSTSPFRTVQLIDGIDGITPVLNFSPGNMLGITDIDIKNIEIVSGPSSAMYGPNAMQGIVNISSFSPFDKQGLMVRLKGGNRSYGDVQVRYAKVIGKKQRFGVKVTASYYQAKEWIATDPLINNYRNRKGTPVNMNNLLGVFAADTTLSPALQAQIDSFVTYTQSNANALPGAAVTYNIKGYNESDLVPEPTTYSFKISPAIHYKITDSLEVSYIYKFSQSSAIYQGNNRAFFKDFTFSQHKLELKGSNFFIKGFINTDNVVNTYDLALTGLSMGSQQQGAYNSAYLLNYINAISAASNGFANGLTAGDITAAQTSAATSAAGTWAQPGTEKFNTLFNSTISSTNRPVGSKYISNSSVWQVDGQYNYKNKIVNVGVGAMFRRYIPRTQGRLFADTLQQDGTYRNISYNEMGGYVQLSKSLWRNKLKLDASFRLDKSQNYDMQYSPRFSASLTLGKHNIRLSAQSAFRTPSLNDQYFLLNVGAFIVRGNITGYDNLYTASSVAAYQAGGNTNPALLKPIVLDPVKPENLQMAEIGYRVNVMEGLYLDVNAFYGVYKHFIGLIRCVEPNVGDVDDATGVAAINARQYKTYNIATNSKSDVPSYGGTASLTYYWGVGNSVYANYAYTKVDTAGLNDNLVAGFNTPAHKVNIGFNIDNLWKGIGLSANWKWMDSFNWQSAFTSAVVPAGVYVPANHWMDLQLSYKLTKAYSVIRIGGSNIYNNRKVQAGGGPLIGATYYVSYTFDIGKL